MKIIHKFEGCLDHLFQKCMKFLLNLKSIFGIRYGILISVKFELNVKHFGLTIQRNIYDYVKNLFIY